MDISIYRNENMKIQDTQIRTLIIVAIRLSYMYICTYTGQSYMNICTYTDDFVFNHSYLYVRIYNVNIYVCIKMNIYIYV